MVLRRRPALLLFVSFMCFAVSALLVPLTHAAPTAAADATLVRLWPGWRDADSFDRIGEFLGNPEPAGRRERVRTQPDARAGYYFLLRVASPVALAPGAKFELQVIRPDSPEPKTFTFPVTATSGDTVFDLGLTGTDWPGGKKINPVAYRLTLLAADGRVLLEHKSFLWEKPAK